MNRDTTERALFGSFVVSQIWFAAGKGAEGWVWLGTAIALLVILEVIYG